MSESDKQKAQEMIRRGETDPNFAASIGVDSDAVRRAFGATSLEPEITDDMLLRFAKGQSDDVESEIIQAVIALQPELGEAILALRKDLESPVPAVSGRSPLSRLLTSVRARWAIEGLALAAVAIGIGVIAFGAGSKEGDPRVAHLQGAVADLVKEKASLEDLMRAATEQSSALRRRLDQSAQDLAKAKAAAQQAAHPPKTSIAGTEFVAIGDEWAKILPRQGAVAQALQGRVDVDPRLRDLPRTGSRGPTSITLVAPDRTAVASVTPTLSWKGKGAGSVVRVYQAGHRIYQSAPVSSDRLPLPAKILEPGRAYEWDVVAGSGKSPRSAFRVLSLKEADVAEAVRRDPTLSPIERGARFAELGLLDEARAEFELVRKENPTLGGRLLEDLSKRRMAPRP